MFSMAAIASSPIQLLEYANQSPVYPGAYEPLNAFTHPRPSRSKRRFLLFGLLCAVLPFTVFAWGTAYKLSLYKTEIDGVPAKVCTRGSDAAKSNISQAIAGRKAIGNGVATPMHVIFPILRPRRHDVALSEEIQGILPLRFGPILAARPPPIRFFFS
jgi:hypothetical protein